VPQLYYPDGNRDNPNQDPAVSASTSGPAVAASAASPSSTGTAASTRHSLITCEFDTFHLKANEAYFVELNADPGTCTMHILGSADDRYDFIKHPRRRAACRCSWHRTNNFVAAPYHLQAVDARDLCVDLQRTNPANRMPTRIFDLTPPARASTPADHRVVRSTWSYIPHILPSLRRGRK